MDNNLDNKDAFLADWFAGKLTDEQLKKYVSNSDFAAYLTLRESFSAIQLSEPDMDSNFAAIQEKLTSKRSEHHSKVIPLFRFGAIAAAILVLFGLFQIFIFSQTLTTDYGATASVRLKDGSDVTFNSKSKIAYPAFFSLNRTIKLEGEAFFKVEKGRTFTVKTEIGEVTVLGTKFNVISRKEYFEVICYEGKVRVSKDGKDAILLAGDAVRFYKNEFETWRQTEMDHPQWLNAESSFRNTPFEIVIDALENQYGQKVLFPQDRSGAKFTGSFTHQNLETALKSVCIPMNLNFKSQNGQIVISE